MNKNKPCPPDFIGGNPAPSNHPVLNTPPRAKCIPSTPPKPKFIDALEITDDAEQYSTPVKKDPETGLLYSNAEHLVDEEASAREAGDNNLLQRIDYESYERKENEQLIYGEINKKLNRNLSELSIINNIGLSDYVLVNIGGVSYRITFGKLRDIISQKTDYFKGYFNTAEELPETGEPGDYAFVGLPETEFRMVIWDDEEKAWEMTVHSEYVDFATFNALQEAIRNGSIEVGAIKGNVEGNTDNSRLLQNLFINGVPYVLPSTKVDFYDEISPNENAKNLKSIKINGDNWNIIQPDIVIPDESVTPEKTTFIKVEESTNIFNKEFAQNTANYWFYNGQPQTNKYTGYYCYTDYIPVVEGDVVNVQGFFPNSYSDSREIVRYEWLDENKSFISGENLGSSYILSTTPFQFTAPANAKYIVFSLRSVNIDYITISINTTLSEYEEYKVTQILDDVYINGDKILNPEVSKEDLEDLEDYVKENIIEKEEIPSINLFDYNFAKNTLGFWWCQGQPQSNQYTTTYSYSNPIEVVYGETVYIQAHYRTDSGYFHLALVRYEFMDANGNVIEGNNIDSSVKVYERQLIVPEGAKSLVITINNSDYANVINENMTIAKERLSQFVEYDPGKFVIPNLCISRKNIIDDEGEEEETTKNLIVDLPKQYDLVVGDTFQLFYEGIIKAKEPLNYNILVNCSVGKAFKRFYEYTPNVAGTYNLSIQVSDDLGNVLANASTSLVCKEAILSPSLNINVLCMGDSLTTGGTWVNELYRRLVMTNSVAQYNEEAPTGKGLSNITFIGKKTTPNGAGYEGFGGWKFSDYNSTSSTTTNYWVNATHDKNDSDQESIWQDSNGVQWQLETIEADKLKFKKHNGSGSLALNGTLTWVSGGENTSNIVYTNAILEDGNPFVYDGVVDFSAYCNDLGIDKIHECFILLGWNNSSTPEDEYKAEAKAFIDKLIAYNPDIKIVLMGLQMPSLDGVANNYGATGVLANYTYMQQHVINLNKWYQDIADEYDNVEFMQICGQFDSRNNMPNSTRKVNTRSSITETYGTNGVHPGTDGYYQIADAVYRKFNNIN